MPDMVCTSKHTQSHMWRHAHACTHTHTTSNVNSACSHFPAGGQRGIYAFARIPTLNLCKACIYMLGAPTHVQIQAFVHRYRPSHAAVQIPILAHLSDYWTLRESHRETGSEILLTFTEKKKKKKQSFTFLPPEMNVLDLLIHSLNKYILNADFMLGIILAGGVQYWIKHTKNSFHRGHSILGSQTEARGAAEILLSFLNTVPWVLPMGILLFQEWEQLARLCPCWITASEAVEAWGPSPTTPVSLVDITQSVRGLSIRPRGVA